MRRALLLASLVLTAAPDADAALVGVNWAADSTPDGLGVGTLGPLGVTLASTDGSVNGGVTFGGNWPGQPGTDGVPGIAALAGANRNAIDWNTGAVGIATITFTGGTVTDPILLFDFTDPNEAFDFADNLTLVLLDQGPVGSASIQAGNVVRLTGAPTNSVNDGFALQLIGTFATISFGTNLGLLAAQSVGFSIAADLAPVPEPGTLGLTTLGLAGLGLGAARRRLRPQST